MIREAMTATPRFCSMVKNAERNLPWWFLFVRELTGESLVVGTGSTHGAPRTAARYVVEVIPFDFTIVGLPPSAT
jgi:hypothetical protein